MYLNNLFTYRTTLLNLFILYFSFSCGVDSSKVKEVMNNSSDSADFFSRPESNERDKVQVRGEYQLYINNEPQNEFYFLHASGEVWKENSFGQNVTDNNTADSASRSNLGRGLYAWLYSSDPQYNGTLVMSFDLCKTFSTWYLLWGENKFVSGDFSLQYVRSDYYENYDSIPTVEEIVSIGNDVWMTSSVKIDKLTWLTHNLTSNTFNDGEPILEAKSDAEWQDANARHQPAWCYFNNDPTLGEKYGKLYNWYAITSNNLAPDGWHVATDEEWTQMINYLEGILPSDLLFSSNCDKACLKLKSKNDWFSNGNGSNSSSFSAYPGGYRDTDGTFKEFGKRGSFWQVSTGYSTSEAEWIIALYPSLFGAMNTHNVARSEGHSVRCVKNKY
jgi:uncharacterized protein (TIGR02145 family)